MHKVIVSNPTNRVVNLTKVLRGGSLIGSGLFTRTAFRRTYQPGYHYVNIGFRVVKGINHA